MCFGIFGLDFYKFFFLFFRPIAAVSFFYSTCFYVAKNVEKQKLRITQKFTRLSLLHRVGVEGCPAYKMQNLA